MPLNFNFIPLRKVYDVSHFTQTNPIESVKVDKANLEIENLENGNANKKNWKIHEFEFKYSFQYLLNSLFPCFVISRIFCRLWGNVYYFLSLFVVGIIACFQNYCFFQIFFTSYRNRLFAFDVCMVFSLCFVSSLIVMTVRFIVRKTMKIGSHESFSDDCCLSLYCQPCTLTQMSVELDLDVTHDGCFSVGPVDTLPAFPYDDDEYYY